VKAQDSFAGTWETTFGVMTLTQEGKQIRGHYLLEGQRCGIEGKVEKNRLTFTYQEPNVKGEGWFELSADGKSFKGKWREQGQTSWGDWTGKRVIAPTGFAGVWRTTYGSMALTEVAGRVQGIYGGGGNSSIDGKLEGKKLTFTYQEPSVKGQGWFELSADGKSFKGKWREQGQTAWRDWRGDRINPVPGRSWLVVLEANWENDLRQQEYSFGSMLRGFFARSEEVKVRHRFFTDAASLTQWCREVAYIPEPVVLVVAAHATPQGVGAGGKTIGPESLARGLSSCGNLKLLHFSACQIMKDKLATEMVKALDRRVSFPISGYSTSVDWVASAVIEFMYLDLILMRNMSPTAAAEQLGKLMPFSGDRAIPGAVIPAAGFKLLSPEVKKVEKK
jgi:hypothetical protein